ncbi:MAG: hypothetical protein WCY41_02430 [Candidatus Micrarchaeia archaeon]
MPSNLPSSFSRGSPKPYTPPSERATPPAVPQAAPQGGASSITMVVAVVALALALLSVYGTYFMEKPLSPSQKAQLMGIADDLRALQDRDIMMTAPVSTTITLNRSYPIKDLFPAKFDIPLSFMIPIDTQLVGLSSTGQPVQFRVQEEVPIEATIPISSAEAFGNGTIRIQKELPVEAKFTSAIKIRAAYGQDLNNIIDKLEAVAGN